MQCQNDNECGSLTASCVSGKCMMSIGSNVPDTTGLTNDDLICMNLIDSGPFQGYYSCPDARSINGSCSCGSCVKEPLDERGQYVDLRCCPKIVVEGDIELCDDSIPVNYTGMIPTMVPAVIAPIPEQKHPGTVPNEFGVTDYNTGNVEIVTKEGFSNLNLTDAQKVIIGVVVGLLIILFLWLLYNHYMSRYPIIEYVPRDGGSRIKFRNF